MEFVDLTLTINVTYGAMSMEQYKRINDFFAASLNDETINNKNLIDFLSLDKRPFSVTSISRNTTPNGDFRTAEISLIC